MDGLHNFKQGVRVQHVVVVEQRDKLAMCQLEAAGRIGRDAAVFDWLVDDHPRHGLGQAAFQLLVGIGSVHQNQFPVRVGLPDNAVQHLIKKFCRGVVERHDDADLRPLQGGGALGLQLAAQRDVCPVPPIIVVQGQPNAEFHITPQLFSALLPQGLGAAAGQIPQVGGIQKPPRHAAHTVLYGQIGGALVVRFCIFGHRLFLGNFRRHGVLFLEPAVLGGDLLRRA